MLPVVLGVVALVIVGSFVAYPKIREFVVVKQAETAIHEMQSLSDTPSTPRSFAAYETEDPQL